jgi:hypothetical protein
VEESPLIDREEVLSLLFSVNDLVQETRAIRLLLEDDDGQEEVQEDLE